MVYLVPLILVPLLLVPLISIHCSSSFSPSTLPLSDHLPEPAFPVYAGCCREKARAATWGKRTDADAGRNDGTATTYGRHRVESTTIERPGLAAQTAVTGLHRGSFSWKQVAVGRGAVLTRSVENKEGKKVKQDVQYIFLNIFESCKK